MTDEGLIESEVEYRYETKLPLQRNEFQEICAALISRGIGFATVYPDRAIHTVYLDTLDLDDYQENIAGISRRKKLRFRWYDEDVQNLSLEIKEKHAQISRKKRIFVKNVDKLRPTSSVVIGELGRQNLLTAVVRSFPVHRPVLEVIYNRAYFELAPGIRMTIDSKICYRRLYPYISSQVVSSPVDNVIELKYSVSHLAKVRYILKGLPARVFRHSKYIVGMDTAFFA